MSIRTLTDADAAITIFSPDVFPSSPVTLQGFATDDIYSTDDLDIAETPMGVDGILSGGYVPKAIVQRFMLQADSLSIDFFETLYAQSVRNRAVYVLSGTTMLPSTQKRYVMTRGFMTGYKPLPDGKKILQARTFAITWNTCTPNLILG